MQVTQTVSEGLKRGYKVVISADNIDARVDTEIKKMQGQTKMPGFRPGKVPLSLLKKLHGKNILGKVLEETINETSHEALKSSNVRPAMQPKIEVTSFAEGSDLEYTIDVEITPEFDVPDFSKMTLERFVVESDDAQVMEAVKKLASQQKNFKGAAKTYKAKKGDAVLIDFLGKIEDIPFDGGAAEGHLLELGSNSFIPGFEDQLVGVKAGEEKQVQVTFPDGYQAEQLSGRVATFDVKVNEVQKQAAVDINDEMAQKFGLKNLDALKDSVKQQIDRESQGLARTKLKRALLDLLAAEVSFDVPDGMVETEFNQIWEQLKAELHKEAWEKDNTIKPGDVAEPDDKVKEEYQKIATRRVRLGLLLAEVGQRNELVVSQDEVTRQISAEAQRYPGKEKQVLEYYKKHPEALAQIRAPLFEEKVVDFILELANVQDKPISRDDLIAIIEAEEAEYSAKEENKKPAVKKPATKKPAAKKPAVKKPAAKKPAAPKKAKAEE